MRGHGRSKICGGWPGKPACVGLGQDKARAHRAREVLCLHIENSWAQPVTAWAHAQTQIRMPLRSRPIMVLDAETDGHEDGARENEFELDLGWIGARQSKPPRFFERAVTKVTAGTDRFTKLRRRQAAHIHRRLHRPRLRHWLVLVSRGPGAGLQYRRVIAKGCQASKRSCGGQPLLAGDL